MTRRPMLAVASLLAASALAACGDDEDPTPTPTPDAGADISTGDTTADTTADTTDDAAAGEVMEDTTFRLTSVQIIAPAGVGPILGNLITSDIDSGKLHVLIQTTAFQTAWPTEFTITGNAGQLAGEDSYTWYDGVVVDSASAEIDADGFFESTDTLSIIFPALEPGKDEPLQIPVSDLSLSGQIGLVDGTYALEGNLQGAILAAEIEGITVDLGTERLLSDLLGGPEEMDYPDDAETKTGWRLSGDIGAVAVDFVETAE